MATKKQITAKGTAVLMEARVTKLLEELGSSEGEVVAKLRELKIKGMRENKVFCPIAIYLRKKRVNAQVARLKIWSAGKKNWGIAPPWPVSEFIQHFDNNMYPDLAAPWTEMSV